MTIIWCMVPEIWSVMDRIFCNFGLFFSILTPSQPEKSKSWKTEKSVWRYYHFTQVYQKSRSCAIWYGYKIICYMLHDIPEIWHVTNVIVIFHFGLFFVLFPPNRLKNKNFQKLNRAPGDAIILHKCTTNYDHMIHCSWDMVRDRFNYFSF